MRFKSNSTGYRKKIPDSVNYIASKRIFGIQDLCQNQFIVTLRLMEMIIGNFFKAEAVRADASMNTCTVVSERNGAIGTMAGDEKHAHELSSSKRSF